MVLTSLRRFSRCARLMTVTGLVAIATVASVTATATPASASAVGCVRWGQKHIPYVNISIPTGQYCFGVHGSGTYVQFTDGSINTRSS